MWHWDQGHLAYFQFDAIRKIAAFVTEHEFKGASRRSLKQATGLAFSAPPTHSPWRQYSRALKLCLLVYESNGIVMPTPIATLLSQPGAVISDEYFHFIAQSFTEPPPALKDWQPDGHMRYPLLFCLKYLLAKAALGDEGPTPLDEMVGAYTVTEFDGGEGQAAFIKAVRSPQRYEAAAARARQSLKRQSRESLKVLSQISYLHFQAGAMYVSLSREDAQVVFEDLMPVLGPTAPTRDEEVLRLASLFGDGSTSDFFEYPNSVETEAVQSGFIEGSKVKRTHITIERNRNLRTAFFQHRPTAVCDVCSVDTGRTYPWTERVMDIHHLLPLSSGTRVDMDGTTFDDVVPVCPTCHRAIHRYYDSWLARHDKQDFEDVAEARSVYNAVKIDFPGCFYA